MPGGRRGRRCVLAPVMEFGFTGPARRAFDELHGVAYLSSVCDARGAVFVDQRAGDEPVEAERCDEVVRFAGGEGVGQAPPDSGVALKPPVPQPALRYRFSYSVRPTMGRRPGRRPRCPPRCAADGPGRTPGTVRRRRPSGVRSRGRRRAGRTRCRSRCLPHHEFALMRLGDVDVHRIRHHDRQVHRLQQF